MHSAAQCIQKCIKRTVQRTLHSLFPLAPAPGPDYTSYMSPLTPRPPSPPLDQHLEDLSSDLADIGISKDLSHILNKGLTPNRLPQPLRTKRAASAFAQAFDIIGGIPRLALWADRNPDKFYPLYARLIPQPTSDPASSPLTSDEMAWVSARRLMYQMSSRTAQDIVPIAPTPPTSTSPTTTDDKSEE